MKKTHNEEILEIVAKLSKDKKEEVIKMANKILVESEKTYHRALADALELLKLDGAVK